MNAPEKILAVPTIPGTPFGGGYYAGRFFIGAIAYALIVAPKDAGEFPATPWNASRQNVAGATSYNDGHANTVAMAEAGSELAQRCLDLRIGDFDDWYLPSRQEGLLAFCELAGAEAFQEGQAEAFECEWYWTSTQPASHPSSAWFQSFRYGCSDISVKDGIYRARAVRRLKI